MSVFPRLSRIFCAALLAASATACLAADNPWNGTWKFNPAKSRMTGEVETVAVSPDGQWSVKSSGLTLNFGCDGKGYPTPGGRTLVCNKVDAHNLGLVITMNDKQLAQVKRTLSADGKQQTVIVTGKSPDGSSFNNTEMFKKLSGGSGWDGQWENIKIKQNQPEIAIVQATGDNITFAYPRTKSSLSARLDGTPATEQGPLAETGGLVSLTGDGPLSIKEVDTLNGTVTEHDTLSVTPDGKTMTVEALRTGGQQKQIYVYDKQ